LLISFGFDLGNGFGNLCRSYFLHFHYCHVSLSRNLRFGFDFLRCFFVGNADGLILCCGAQPDLLFGILALHFNRALCVNFCNFRGTMVLRDRNAAFFFDP
jgi:hypothetical protein